MASAQDCIFCKIAEGKIPCDKVYEDKEFLAFLDITPVNQGHVLLIPKKHSETLLDMESNELEGILGIARKIAGAMMFSMNKEGIAGFNLGMNNFKAAGQLVNHSHFHIIPRSMRDGLRHWEGRKYKEGEAKRVAEKIRKAL